MVWLAIAIVGMALVLDVWYFMHGSLEWYPTEEQQVKIRVVTGAAGTLLASVEAGLWLLLRRMGSRPALPRSAR